MNFKNWKHILLQGKYIYKHHKTVCAVLKMEIIFRLPYLIKIINKLLKIIYHSKFMQMSSI